MKREGADFFADDDVAEAQGLLIEEPAAPLMWLVFGAATLLFVGLIAICIPPTKGRDWGCIAMSLMFGPVMGYVTAVSFRRRDDATRYYRDRVEVFRGGRLLHRLAYTDVEKVAYGFQPGGMQQLTFSGPGGEPHLSLILTEAERKSEPTSPHALTEAKLISLRDLLNGLVSQAMLRHMDAGRPVQWFGDVVVTRHGLNVGEAIVPWQQVAVTANDETGEVTLAAGAAGTRRTSMVNDNVVPGLMIAEQMRQRKAA
jgi:hypothetical protein